MLRKALITLTVLLLLMAFVIARSVWATVHYVASTGAPWSSASPSSALPLPSNVVIGMLSLAVAAAVALVIGFASLRKKSG